MPRTNLDGFPTSFGSERASVFLHKGPASYVQITVATPPTGGDSVTAGEAGIKYFDFLDCDMVSDDGQFVVQAISPNGNTAGAGTAAVPATKMLLRWVIAATGAEVAGAVNLSGRTVRMMAYGPK